jgi:thiol:disulfide interchange protein/DsbC/DsbD-like thiol-disulfide interchange protein
MFRFHIPLLALLCFTMSVRAQFGLPGGAPQSVAVMTAEVKSIAPGSTFTVALKLSHPEEWHSYYQNSGGVELPPSIKWTLPEGFTAGPIQWPVPQVKDGFFGKSFVYVGSPVFLSDITAPSSLTVGQTVTFTADTTWQICKESCINENKSFTFKLPVTAAPEKDPAAAALIKDARATQPLKAAGWTFSASPAGEDFLLRVKPAGALENDPVDFVPDQPFVQSASSGGAITRDGDVWSIRLKRATKDALENNIPQGDAFSGVLTGERSVAVPLTRISAASPEALSFSKFLPVLGGMLLGGLILNLMPCVFPVIGLKIMGFVQQAGADRRKIALHGITFALGVFASFGVLSGILFTARESFGWGYQLQNPWVVLSLMLLMFVLALNMFGVFEIGASATSVGGSLQSKQGLAGSFFSGVLATVVATPCSAPFLGAAIGAAIALPAFQFFAAFGFMALGLALPYLVLSIFPKLIDFLPRPGPWMESFKQAMSFLLFATAGYLLWVYAGLIDLDNLLGPVFGLSCIAIACWIHGRWNLPHREKGTRFTAIALSLLFAVAGLFLSKPPKPSALDWQPWSLEKQEALLDEGKPVYIDFTAKWCATCQVNKKRAYTKEVVALMKNKGVVTLKGDKTKPDPQIEQALQKYGRTAIPVNVLLEPGKEPVILPELLSPDDVLKALRNL